MYLTSTGHFQGSIIVPLPKYKISKLVSELNSAVESEARRAASQLDELLYPNYGPGPRLVTAVEAKVIDDEHFGALRGTTTLDPLLEAARSGTGFARAYALTALGAIREARVLSLASNALSDSSPMVRLSATKALWYFRELSTVALLIRALGDSDSEVRCSAADALGFMRSVDAVVPLTEFYERGDNDSRVAALHALGDISDQRSLPLMRSALLDKNRKIRKAAKFGLAKYDFTRRSET